MTFKKDYTQKKSIYFVLFTAGILFAAGLSIKTYADQAFEVKKDTGGKYWFVDPKGKQFLSIGINNIRSEPWQPKPNTQYYGPVKTLFKGDFEAWKKDVFGILQEYGFNTLGAWSDERLYDGPVYGTICLYVAAHAKDRCLDGLRTGFEDRVKMNTKMALETYPSTDNIFGVFLDNEMPWYGHAPWGEIPNSTLLEAALSLPKEDEARKAAMDFLKKKYESPEAISKAWGKSLASWDDLNADYARGCLTKQASEDRAAFIGVAAEAFYTTAAKIARQMLPGKLILGTRFAGYAPQPVISACGRHCDVVSFNNYRAIPSADPDMLARFWIWSGKKPLMVTEYAWRGRENSSGNPNTGGAGAVVQTQAERAKNYSSYVEDLLSYPMVIGAHWFEFADQSPQGRFDGENSNYGIVDIHHRPYKELLAAMKQTNSRIQTLHAQSKRTSPDALPKPKAVAFEPGQYPDRPASVNLLDTIAIQDPELYHASDARITLGKEDNAWVITLDTGKDWGCGVIFFGPKDFKTDSGPDFSTDLGGYSAIELDAAISSDVTFDFFLDEAGVASPDAAVYDTSGGDDGESFLIPTIKGKGSRALYRFQLSDLMPRTNWGNQRGLGRVDITSIKGVSLFFHGSQGSEKVQVFSLKLAR